MNQKYSLKRLLLSSLVAILLVLLQPSIFMTSVVLCITPIAIASLYAWSGIIPASILAGGTVLMLGAYAAGMLEIPAYIAIHPLVAALGALAVLVVPAVVSIAVQKKNIPFFERMSINITVQMAALLLCAGVVQLVMRMDLVNIITDSMLASTEQMTADMKLYMLNMFNSMGILTKESAQSVNEILKEISEMDATQFQLTGYVLSEAQIQTISAALVQAGEYLNYHIRQIMPAMLVHSGMLSGILLTALPAKIACPHVPRPMPRVRIEMGAANDEEDKESDGLNEGKPDEQLMTNEFDLEAMLKELGVDVSQKKCTVDRVPLLYWQIPRHILGMMLVGVLAGLGLQWMNMASAEAVTAVFSLLLSTLLIIQGLAAMGRFTVRLGASDTFRIGISIAALLFATPFLEMMGASSALFGSRGVYTAWIKKRMEENGKDDDEE